MVDPAKPKKQTKHTVLETMSLRHDFDQNERNAITNQLTMAIRQKGGYENELAAIKSDFKGKIELADAVINSTTGSLTSGYEMRTVDVKVVFNRKNGTKEIFYNTPGQKTHGKSISVEDMTQNDFQRLPIEVPITKKPTAVPADEINKAVEVLRARHASGEAFITAKSLAQALELTGKTGKIHGALIITELCRRKILGEGAGAGLYDIVKLPEPPPIDTAAVEEQMKKNQVAPGAGADKN